VNPGAMAVHQEDEDVPDNTVKTDDLAVTNQRVNTLERSVRDLSEDLNRTSRDLSTQIGNVATNLMAELKGVTGQLSERSKIPWQALGVMLTFVTVIGGLVYWPIKDSQARLETQLLRIAEGAVSQKEFNERWATGAARRDDWQRASEDRSRDNRNLIEKLRDAVVPRSEHEEKWRGADNKFADLQRQLDKQEKAFGDTYSLKDVLARMQRRQDELESELRQARLTAAAAAK
jgi:hypothetical protein